MPLYWGGVLLDKLEAVNKILEAIGDPPAAALDTDGDSEVSYAERHLDQADREIQQRGWTFNTRREVTLTAQVLDNSTYRIVVPGNILRLIAATSHSTPQVTVVNGRLFRLDTNTDEWSSGDTVKVDYVEQVRFELIPLPIADYIVAAAADRHNRRRTRIPDLYAVLGGELVAKRVQALQHEGDDSRLNLLETTESRRFKGNRMPLPHAPS